MSLGHLGSLIYLTEDRISSGPYLRRALAIRERVLGADHLETAESRSS
jgi:hypothetical protein